MSKWGDKRLVDVCSRVVSGGTPLKSRPEYYENGDIPWLKTGEVKKYYIYGTEEKITQQGLLNSSAKMVPKDSVIIAMYGDGNTAGNVAINKIDLTTNQACCNLILNKKIAFYRFIYFYLKGSYNNLVNLKSGGSQQNLNAQTIKNFNIRIPPLSVQKKIAAVLSAYDDLIENNDRRIALLEKMAEEIYREWFVRLRFPGYEQVTFHKGIPEGWEIVTLDDLADITSSKRIYAQDYVQDGVPFYRSKEIIQKASNVEISEPIFISIEKFNEIKDRFGAPQKGDILITSVGTLGVSYLVKEDEYFYFKDGNLIWFRKNDYFTNKYLYFWLQSGQGKNSLLETTIGTSQPAFTIVNLKKISILKPSRDLLERFIYFVDPINSQKEKLLAFVQNLKQTRDRLLTRLISGKLSVEDLDIQFPPSMTTEP
jgi:type I restriction enzyme, S subunit